MDTPASDTESERWEDFFGSSTELAPSLLVFYDTLTSALDSNVVQVTDSTENDNNRNIERIDELPGSRKNITDDIPKHSICLNEEKSSDFEIYSPSLRTSTPTAESCHPLVNSFSTSNNNKHRNNIRVLSPNVQRIITHSDKEPVDSVDIEALQNQIQTQCPVESSLPSNRFTKRSSSIPVGKFSHKVKPSHIPLSKITCKLTQSGNELVETFDSSTEYLDVFHGTHFDLRKKHHSTIEVGTHPLSPTNTQSPGAEKIGTSPKDRLSAAEICVPFSEKRSLNNRLSTSSSQESIKLVEMEKLATISQLLNDSKSDPISLNDFSKTKEFEASNPPLSPLETAEALNFSLITSSINKLSLSDMDDTTCIIEAVNKPLITKPLIRSSSAVSSSPLLTYARSRNLFQRANTLAVPIKVPIAQLQESEEASKISAESLDRLTDIKSKFSPKESRKISSLLLPDIAKLKHRPLSSASICSTSSSSSSGSELLNGKIATSYLASVESLADQSENELLDPHSGMSIFERSCLEIVDSEKSYVEDLGQVIKGYLHDWKERACLQTDELNILFSNIEEIYQFNSTLLKLLENAGSDPAKIAKCFIQLQEHFDVYTTYCTQYPEAISLLTKLLQATHTNTLLNLTQKLLRHTLPLGSYLLKPVQRILKYHLLLDNLRKHCDVKEVVQAYELMRQVARHIDQVKKKLEQQSRVKELSGILDGWLGPELTVLGELRHEGLLMEHNKPRMVFLFETMLIITKPKEDNRLQFKSYIHQNNLMLNEQLAGEPTSFYVIPFDEPRNQIKLTAKNRDQKRLWSQHIKGVILEKFDIPNRAKELVYKLGDEDDRQPDKLPRKWPLHSNHSTTPRYLERRNQYRRSEIKYQKKIKRQTLATTTPFENFNEIVGNSNEGAKKIKSLSRNNSIDETFHKFTTAVRKKQKGIETDLEKHSESTDKVSNHSISKSNETINQIETKIEANHSFSAPKSPKTSYKTLKQRSKSVPRIAFPTEGGNFGDSSSLTESSPNLDSKKMKSNKTTDIEIKQYNHKTLPKRIATLKKQRQKETSKFYLDLTELDSNNSQTILKITESTENLTQTVGDSECNIATEENVYSEIEKKDEEEVLSPSEKIKRDAQIISELLKYNKEFEKFAVKNTKKKQKDTVLNSPSIKPPLPDVPPRPPSKSPPPLDTENEHFTLKTKDDAKFEVHGADADEDGDEEEPIYETLLTDIHFPLNSSSVLGNSNSTNYFNNREKKTPHRPESDYVTLVYSPQGNLEPIGDEDVPRYNSYQISNWQGARDSARSSSSDSSSTTIKRDSQNTVISLDLDLVKEISSTSRLSDTTAGSEAVYATPIPKKLMKRLLQSNNSKISLENVSSSENSLVSRSHKSFENIGFMFGRNNKFPERRVSDVSDVCRQSYFHRQGSEAVGERIAHVDYADPKTLFTVVPITTSVASLQRDSVFSLTSSNDSVCDFKRSLATNIHLSTGFEYEDNVEASLENDFRDSAVYSDDNDKRLDTNINSTNEGKTALEGSFISIKSKPYPCLPPKPSVIPPPTIKSKEAERLGSAKTLQNIPGVVMCPTKLSQSAARSWVLQQIENFNK